MGSLGLREMKPPDRGQRASGRGGTGVPEGTGLASGPLLAVDPGFKWGFEWDHEASGWPRSSYPLSGEIFLPPFSPLCWAGPPLSPQNKVGHLQSPSPVALIGKACPLVKGRVHF